MDPLALPQVVEKYGGWGAAAFILAAAIWAFRGWMSCTDARIADGAKTAVALAAATDAIKDVQTALDSRQGYFERIGGKQDDLSRQVGDLARSVEELRRETRR